MRRMSHGSGDPAVRLALESPPGAALVRSPSCGHRYPDAPQYRDDATAASEVVAADGAEVDARVDDIGDEADLLQRPPPHPGFVRQLGEGLLYGSVGAVICIPMLIGFTSIIFRDPAFAPYQPKLVKLVLWSAAVHQVVFSFASRLPFAMGQVQDAGLIFLSAMATGCVAASPAAQAVPTALCTLTLGTMLLGAALIVTGRMRAASLVQYLPMPVVSGYLGYIGIFCLEAGLALSTGLPIGTDPRSWALLWDATALVHVLPAVAVGVLLTVASGQQHPGALPTAFFISFGSFYLFLWFSGCTVADARAGGWLTSPTPQTANTAGFGDMFSLYDFRRVYWPAALRQLPTWLGMYFVVAFSSCLDVAAIEVYLGRPLNVNHELGKVVGVSNFVSGCTGGFTGSYIISLTVLVLRTCHDNRICGWVCAGLLLTMVFVPVTATDYVPHYVFAGSLIFVGADLMSSWLYGPVAKLAYREGVVVIATFVFINITGLEFGLVLGVAFSAVLFIVEHASNPSVVCAHRVSRTLRTPEQRAYLRRHYGQIVQFQLHGHLFFGSAVAVLNEVKRHIHVPVQAAEWEQQDESGCCTGSPTEQTPLLPDELDHTPAPVPLARLISLQQVVAHDPPAHRSRPSSLVLSDCSPSTPKPRRPSRLQRRRSVRLRRTRFVVFDFDGVPGVDTTAVRTCFLTLKHQLRTHDIRAVFCGLTDSVQSQFERSDLLTKKEDHFCTVCPSFDDALEWCETELLRDKGAPGFGLSPLQAADGAANAECTMEEALVAATKHLLPPNTPVDQLRELARQWLPRHFEPGSVLCVPGEDAADLRMLLRGSVEVRSSGGWPPAHDRDDCAADEQHGPEQHQVVARLRPGMLVGDADWQLRQRWSFLAVAGSEGAFCAVLPGQRRQQLSPEQRLLLMEILCSSTAAQLLSTFGEK